MIAARIPASRLAAHNAALEAQGFGPDSFSIPVYNAADTLTHYALHCAHDNPKFEAAVEALTQVRVSKAEGDPEDRLRDAMGSVGYLKRALPDGTDVKTRGWDTRPAKAFNRT